MEAIWNYGWAQGKLDEIFGTESEERHAEQREHRPGENRAQRRERERQELKTAKRKAKA